jgi:3-oxoadipate enol-lactonase
MREPLDVDCDTFAWRESGAGELVVLLHGLGGSRLSWEPQLTALGHTRRIVAWDLPGYGAAAPLPDDPLTFRALADAAAGFITAVGAEQAHVVGISMGGMIGQYLAAWHPQRVRSLALLSSSPAFGLDGTRPDEWKATRLAALDQGLEPGDFADRVLSAIGGPHLTAEAMAGQRAAMARISGQALRRSIDCLVTHDTRQLLPGIAAPTLVMVGELDVETPVQYSRYLADHLPHGELVVIPSAGHLLNVEAPDTVNELIERHLAAVEAA